MPPKKKGSDSPFPREPRKKPVADIMIPRRRDFMGDLADWFVESPENQKQLDAMLQEIFAEVAQNRKARGEVLPPKEKKPSKKKVTLKWSGKILPSSGEVPSVGQSKAVIKKRSKKKQ